jgi:hypothetical protein
VPTALAVAKLMLSNSSRCASSSRHRDNNEQESLHY